MRHGFAYGLVLLTTTGVDACSKPSHQPLEAARAVPMAAPSVPLRPEPQSAANAYTNRIRCGTATCDATDQVCCNIGDVEDCAPRVHENPGQSSAERVEPLVKSCQLHVQSQFSLDAVILCDDSTDCPDGYVCCSQWLWSGAALLACVPASPSGSLVCDFHERCVHETCRTRGTHCVRSECRLADGQVACGSAKCGPGTTCCQRGFESAPVCEPSCEPANDDERVFEFECSRSQHCPPGATCQAGLFGSYCSGLVDTANAVTLCESDDDCAPDGCAWLGKTSPPRCKEGQRTGFKSCDCD